MVSGSGVASSTSEVGAWEVSSGSEAVAEAVPGVVRVVSELVVSASVVSVSTVASGAFSRRA